MGKVTWDSEYIVVLFIEAALEMANRLSLILSPLLLYTGRTSLWLYDMNFMMLSPGHIAADSRWLFDWSTNCYCRTGGFWFAYYLNWPKDNHIVQYIHEPQVILKTSTAKAETGYSLGLAGWINNLPSPFQSFCYKGIIFHTLTVNIGRPAKR